MFLLSATANEIENTVKNIQDKNISNNNKARVCYGCETWTLTKHNELLLQRFERKIFGPIQDPATGQYRIRTNAELETNTVQT